MKFLSLYSIKLPVYLVYMLQQVEYEPAKFIEWLFKKPDLSRVMYRKNLVMTKKAAALVAFQYVFLLLYLVILGMDLSGAGYFAVVLIIILPAIDLVILLATIYAGYLLLWPLNKLQIKKSRKIFAEHKGLKIVILGSYGKTTMKELLREVLDEHRKVRATPGNKNVPISHARWAKTLNGKEDVLLIELGESKPGDISMFCKNISPDIAVVTGVAPNHLDKYKTLENLKDDIASVADYVRPENIYINAEAKDVIRKIKSKALKPYDQNGVDDVRIENVKLDITGMNFTAELEASDKVKLSTELVGRHLLGPLSVCVSLAKKTGIFKNNIAKGIKKTKPFEHRLQVKEINGAWIIDDTYNGSIEGFRAGLDLLKELKAKRKLYVTPGLVDQGEETENVHKEIGKLIAKANPDKVVLIKNSTTDIIKKSLKKSGFTGQLEVRSDALEFYTGLEHIMAAGDVIMLQNDWTDNYY